MDHAEAVREKATEKYLLNELDREVRDQFEEHMFDCQECAMDVRAAAMFVEQSKAVLAEASVTANACTPLPDRQPRGRWNWLRPAFTVPVFALLLVVIGYQDHLMRAAREPQLPTWASLLVDTRGGGQDAEPIQVKTKPGAGFSLLVDVASDPSAPAATKYSSFNFELYNPAGKLQWSSQIAAPSPDDHPSIYVPGTGLEQGNYTLAIHKISAAGEVVEKHPIQVQIEKVKIER
jgi:hypothetical protein